MRVGVEMDLGASTLASYVDGVAVSKALLGLQGPLYVAAACAPAEAPSPSEGAATQQPLGLRADLLLTLTRHAAPPAPPAAPSDSAGGGSVASAFASCGPGGAARAGAAVHVLGGDSSTTALEGLDLAWKASALARRLAPPPAQPPSLRSALGEAPFSFSGVPFTAASPLHLLLPHVPSEGASEAASAFATRVDVPRDASLGRPPTFLAVKPWGLFPAGGASPPLRMAMRLGVTEAVPAGAAAAAVEEERVALGFFECTPDFLDVNPSTVLGLRLVRSDGFATALCLYSCNDVAGGGAPRRRPLSPRPAGCHAPHLPPSHVRASSCVGAGPWELLGTQTVADNPAGLSWFVELQIEHGAAHPHAALVHAISPPERLPAPPAQPARATPAPPARAAAGAGAAAAAPLLPATSKPPAAYHAAAASPRRLGRALAASLLEIVAARCAAWLVLPPEQHTAGARLPLGPQPSPGAMEACLHILNGAADGTAQGEELRLGAMRVLDACARVLLRADAPAAAFEGAARALPAALRDGVWRALRDERAGAELRGMALDALLTWMQLSLEELRSPAAPLLSLFEPRARWHIVDQLSNIALVEGEQALSPLERLAATTLPERLAADWVASADDNIHLELQRLLEQAAGGGGERRGLVALLHAVQAQLLLAAAGAVEGPDGAEVRRAVGRYAQMLLPLAARTLGGDGGSGTLQDPFVSLLLLPWLEAAPELCEEVKVPVLQLLCQMHRVVQEMRAPSDGGCGAEAHRSPVPAAGLLLRYRVHLQLGDARATRTLRLPRAAHFTFECVAPEDGTPGATPPVEGLLEAKAVKAAGGAGAGKTGAADGPLVNDDGAPVNLGQPGKEWRGQNGGELYFCGRRLGRQAIPGSDGQCGPTHGPQCSSCKRFQDAFQSGEVLNDEGARVWLSRHMLLVSARVFDHEFLYCCRRPNPPPAPFGETCQGSIDRDLQCGSCKRLQGLSGSLEVFDVGTQAWVPKERQASQRLSKVESSDGVEAKTGVVAGASSWLVADGKALALVTPDGMPPAHPTDRRQAAWPAHLALDGVAEALKLSWNPAHKPGGGDAPPRAPRRVVVSAAAPLPSPPPDAASAAGALRDALGAALMRLLASTLEAATLSPQGGGGGGGAVDLRAVVRQLAAGSAAGSAAADWKSLLELHRLVLARVCAARLESPRPPPPPPPALTATTALPVPSQGAVSQAAALVAEELPMLLLSARRADACWRHPLPDRAGLAAVVPAAGPKALDHTDSRSWTCRWEDGRWEDGKRMELRDGKWVINGENYQLRSTSPVSFTWPSDGTLQTVAGWDGRTVTWSTTNPSYPRIYWDLLEDDGKRLLQSWGLDPNEEEEPSPNEEHEFELDDPQGPFQEYTLHISAPRAGSCLQLCGVHFSDEQGEDLPYDKISINCERCHGDGGAGTHENPEHEPESHTNLNSGDEDDKWCTDLSWFPLVDGRPTAVLTFTFEKPVTVGALVFVSAGDACDYPEREPKDFELYGVSGSKPALMEVETVTECAPPVAALVSLCALVKANVSQLASDPSVLTSLEELLTALDALAPAPAPDTPAAAAAASSSSSSIPAAVAAEGGGAGQQDELRVVEISGRTGWYVDQVSLTLSDGRVVKYGGDGGSPVPPQKLRPDECIVAVHQNRHPEYLGSGFTFKLSSGRELRVAGSKDNPNSSTTREHITSKTAPSGKQITSLHFSGSELVGAGFSPRAAKEREQPKVSLQLLLEVLTSTWAALAVGGPPLGAELIERLAAAAAAAPGGTDEGSARVATRLLRGLHAHALRCLLQGGGATATTQKKPSPLTTCPRNHSGCRTVSAHCGGTCDVCDEYVSEGDRVLQCEACAADIGNWRVQSPAPPPTLRVAP